MRKRPCAVAARRECDTEYMEADVEEKDGMSSNCWEQNKRKSLLLLRERDRDRRDTGSDTLRND